MQRTLRAPSLLKRITAAYTAVLWICLGGLLLIALALLTLPFDVDGTDPQVTTVMTTVAIIIGLSAAICIRYIFDHKASLAALGAKAWTVLWLFPLAVTVIMLPWLLGGVLADERTSVAMSLFLWVLIAYGSLLLGFLLVPFVILPLELIGRGILALLGGRHKEAGPMLIFGGYIALVTAFGFVGGFAIDNEIPGRFGAGNVLFALLGLPASYSVENEGLLWIARLMAVILIAVPLAFAVRGKQDRPQEFSGKKKSSVL